jgi:HD-GYP domain-containing protein (c-di-GMP phosphodiesterase class II)
VALLEALGASDAPLDPVLRRLGELCGMPAVIYWKPDARRLQLAHRHGDDLLASDAPNDLQLGTSTQDEAGTHGVPLHVPATEPHEPHVMAIRGGWFGAVGTGGGLLAIGPLGGDELSRRQRRDLVAIGALADGPIRQALRIALLNAQVRSLREEADLQRRSLGSATDEATALGLLLDLAVGTSGAIGGFVSVCRATGLEIVAHRQLPAGFSDLDLTPGRGILATIPGVPGVLVVEGAEHLARLGIGGLVAVGGPAEASDPEIVMGLLADDESVLEPDCAPLLATLVDVASIVSASADVARGTARRHLAALEGLCRALDARTPALHGHHVRVAALAEAIAARLALPEDRCALIAQAARIHDVGLIAASGDAVIAAEFAHPAVGADMAALVPGAAELGPVLRAHHEWWDGFGFPNSLVGEAIPVEARVLAAAEFLAETERECADWDTETLVGEVAARAGSQLDPACAHALIELIEEL